LTLTRGSQRLAPRPQTEARRAYGKYRKLSSSSHVCLLLRSCLRALREFCLLPEPSINDEQSPRSYSAASDWKEPSEPVVLIQYPGPMSLHPELKSVHFSRRHGR